MSENIGQEGEVLITKENMFDFHKRDLEGLEKTLKELNMDTLPEELPQKPKNYKNCRCGNKLLESPKGQFRCGLCGNILYKKNSEAF